MISIASIPTRLKSPSYSITEADWKYCQATYGACNCGPTALATMLNLPCRDVMPHLNGYKEKHYVNPTMMKEALTALDVKFHDRFRRGYERVTIEDPHMLCEYGLIRIQWQGPWTEPGANPKWAYRQTHWIGSMQYPIRPGMGIVCVFDVNSGWTSQLEWETKTIPSILKECVPRATGGWFATHRLELDL